MLSRCCRGVREGCGIRIAVRCRRDRTPAPEPRSTRTGVTVRYMDRLGALAGDNATLLFAHGQACAEDKYPDPSHQLWHRHLGALFADGRPDLDADFPAHPVLAAFDGDLIRHMTPPDEPRHFTGSIQQMAMADRCVSAYRPRVGP